MHIQIYFPFEMFFFLNVILQTGNKVAIDWTDLPYIMHSFFYLFLLISSFLKTKMQYPQFQLAYS